MVRSERKVPSLLFALTSAKRAGTSFPNFLFVYAPQTGIIDSEESQPLLRFQRYVAKYISLILFSEVHSYPADVHISMFKSMLV